VTASKASRRLASEDAALASATQQAQVTADTLANQRAARNAYIASLAQQRRLTQGQIAAVVAQANAARIRSQQLVRAAAPSSATTPISSPASTFDTATPSTVGPAAAAPSGRTLTVTATGYALPGRTATGLPVGWGVVAVDPSVIPLGSHMTVPGYGEAVAADTGGAIIGATIDLWFPTVAQADAWGRRTVTITLH